MQSALRNVTHYTGALPKSAAVKAHASATARSSPASAIGAQLSHKTEYTRTILTQPLQKRFYASKAPVTAVAQDADVTAPPDQFPYRKNLATYDEHASRNLAYLMIGTYGFVQAVAVKNVVTDLLVSMAPSADVLALAKVEVDQASIPEGKNVVIKWRGKPIFIRHRTSTEISEANEVNMAELRDPEADDVRTKSPEWLVMIGVCTHLGCVPIGEDFLSAGEYGGWFCPCHGSHYDISGRIRKGPAPLNLEIPPYELTPEGKILNEMLANFALIAWLVASVVADAIIEPEFEKVTCGSAVKLVHSASGFRLHSHSISYGSGSGQQSVTGFAGADDPNSLFTVVGPLTENCIRGRPIKCNAVVRLEHSSTRKFLHSHLHQSPLSSNQEVSAYEFSDVGDHWKVICTEKKEKYWKREQKVRFQHVETSKYLSSNTKYQFRNPIPGQLEICAVSSAGANELWNVQGNSN
ncbi:hypothetical protein HK101_000260 [Irineochytrium annulatum]|nr:hypothetical protein HK101_000260 [Irineochytrium annulatum]